MFSQLLSTGSGLLCLSKTYLLPIRPSRPMAGHILSCTRLHPHSDMPTPFSPEPRENKPQLFSFSSFFLICELSPKLPQTKRRGSVTREEPVPHPSGAHRGCFGSVGVRCNPEGKIAIPLAFLSAIQPTPGCGTPTMEGSLMNT